MCVCVFNRARVRKVTGVHTHQKWCTPTCLYSFLYIYIEHIVLYK